MRYSAGEFKTHCLKLMDEVQRSHRELIITKRGKPVAKLVAADPDEISTIFGFLKDSVDISGNIVSSAGGKWNADE